MHASKLLFSHSRHFWILSTASAVGLQPGTRFNRMLHILCPRRALGNMAHDCVQNRNKYSTDSRHEGRTAKKSGPQLQASPASTCLASCHVLDQEGSSKPRRYICITKLICNRKPERFNRGQCLDSSRPWGCRLASETVCLSPRERRGSFPRLLRPPRNTYLCGRTALLDPSYYIGETRRWRLPPRRSHALR
jgi:hypothetical protein